LLAVEATFTEEDTAATTLVGEIEVVDVDVDDDFPGVDFDTDDVSA
jgi:hypothetical protein